MCAPPYFKERASKKPVTQAAGAGSSSISQVSAAPTPDPSPNSTPSVSPARIRPATKLLPRPVRTASALPLPTPQPYITNNAPGGFATSGGTLINPQVINNGPPPAKIAFIEEVISPISLTGGGEKIMKIHITTDRSIPGAIIGIIFSGPFDLNRHTGGETLDEPTIKNAVMFQVNWTFSAALSQGGSPIPNSASVAISSPAAFLPGQELICSR
jgi:hypothetical protein